MDSGKVTLAERCDNLILNTYHQAAEIILTGRNAEISPSLTSQGRAYLDLSLKDYITQLISTWKKNIAAPLVIDLYLYDNNTNESLLMERWKFVYNRNDDIRDGRFTTVQKKVITFIRSLYCFVRLLPGFQLLKLSPNIVNINCTFYNPDKNGVPTSFIHETITYQFPQLLTPRGILLVELKYINGSNLQKILKIASKLTILTSPMSKGGSYNTAPQSNKSNATPIPIPITSGAVSPFTPQYFSPENNQKSRSNSLDNEYSETRIRSSGGGAGINNNSNSSKLSTPQRNSVHSTPPKTSNFSDKKPPLYPDSGYTSINSSPNAYPPFMMQQNILHTGQSPTMQYMNNLALHDETMQGLSPPFPQSLNLLSTSPNIGNGIGNNSYSIHSYRESLRRASFERMKQSATQQLLEFNVNLKVALPNSPFTAKAMYNETAGGKAIPSDSNKDRESFGGTKDRDSIGDRDRLSSIDDDAGDAAFALEEEMPFAWGQTEGIIPFTANNNTQPIAKLCIAPPALVSFSEGVTDQCINETSLTEHIKQLDDFRRSLN